MPDTVSRRRWPWLLVLVLLAIAALFWRYSVSHSSEGATPAVKAGGAQRPTESASDKSARGTRLSIVRRNQPPPGISAPLPVTLPPLNTKVADVLSQLKDAADHGDSRAACRLGAELSRCFKAHRFMAMADSETQDASKEQDPARGSELRKSADALRQAMVPDLDMCQGVAASDYNEAWSYLVQSASAGNAEAAAYFYMAPPLSSENTDASDLQTVWSDHREQYRDMAIQAGNVYALNAASVLEAIGIGPFGARSKYPPNFYNALMYSIALMPLNAQATQGNGNEYLDLLRAKLTPQQIADAERDGVAIRQKYFQGVQPVNDVQKSGTLRPERCANP